MPLISVRDLHKSYGDRTVLDGIDLDVEEGEIVGILGANGAGKTTLVECIGGLRRPDSGTIEVAGLDPTREPLELRERLGMQLQECRLPGKLRTREALELYASFYADPRDIDGLLDRFGLTGQADTRFMDLSGGQQQRLSVALALIGRPRIAILDELTTGLDPAARREIWGFLEELRADGVTLVLVTHFMEEAEYLCDRVIVLGDGHVVASGAPDSFGSTPGEQVFSFVPSVPLDAAELADLRALPGVFDVATNAGRIQVRGNEDVVSTIAVALAERARTIQHVRVHTESLDDAYLRLTQESRSEHAATAPTKETTR